MKRHAFVLESDSMGADIENREDADKYINRCFEEGMIFSILSNIKHENDSMIWRERKRTLFRQNVEFPLQRERMLLKHSSMKK